MAISGPAVAVGVHPNGGLVLGAGERLWLTDRSGASESLELDYGTQRARVRDIRALAIRPDGRVAVADAGGNRVWDLAMTRQGLPIKVIAGTGTTFYPLGDGAKAIAAQLDAPSGVAWLPDGSLLISDTGHGRVRKVSPDGRISTIAGTGVPGPEGDGGPAAKAYLNRPGPLATGPDGTAIVAELGTGAGGTGRIRRISPDGAISTLARMPAAGLAIGPDGVVFASVGQGIAALWEGGTATAFSGLHGPLGLTAMADRTLAVADTDRAVYLEPAKPQGQVPGQGPGSNDLPEELSRRHVGREN